MITINEAEEILKKEYYVDNFEYLLGNILLPDYLRDKHEVTYSNSLFSSVTMLGKSNVCDITAFEVYVHKEAQKRRVGITQEMFRILRGLHINNALVSFVNEDKRNYRISLLTSRYQFEGDKIIKVLSNPRRYSYSLGYGTKTKTAYKFLIEKGKVESLDELIERFSVEVVNKQFYTEVATAFTELVGGERSGRTYERLLNLYSVVDHNKYAEFGVRLIGRIMFCWFLREKHSENGIPLVPDEELSLDTVRNSDNYYHQILEPLFFELLNTKQNRRKPEFQNSFYEKVPYLNGGLFSPHTDDFYKYDPVGCCGAYGIVNIPNEWFVHLYSVLSEYNFTVDENTAYDIELSIDPEMLGRIFENLLAEINPETGENAKKSTGSFYTPRDIVDYMVDYSLCEYLKNKTGIDEEKLKSLISYSKENGDLAVFSYSEKKKLIDALYVITILDPACGSGAFPIGMLQKIVYLLQELDPDATMWFDKATENVSVLIKREFEKKFNSGSLNYIRKLSVIQNSIFGIDIQPIAVEISRLRCFLSLIIEEKVHDDEDNRGINPLPNLDFKFIIANSLIGLDEEVQLSLFESQEHINQLKTIREEYFNADSAERADLRLEFSNVQQDMLLNTINNYGKQSSLRYTQLSAWKPFSNEATTWFDPDWMFGIKNGFDIVIGNPPYIQLQKSVNEKGYDKLGDFYQKYNYKTFTRTGDIYCLFYEKGIDILRENGLLCFITSNKWMRAGYGEKLRNFLAENTDPVMLIDFAGTKVFEAATVDVNIIVLSKRKNRGVTKSVIASEDCLNNLSVFAEQNSSTMSYCNSDSWIILSPIEQSIKNKINAIGVPLSEWDVRIYRGILTGCNEAFIINGKKKDELIHADPKSAEIIRPILRGRDIKRYGYNFADLWLINVHNGITNRETPKINIDDYPAIKGHLSTYYNKLAKRADKGDTPYNLRSCAYLDDFSKQKIIWGEISDRPKFAIDTEGIFFPEATTFLMVGDHLKYLLCFLNSKLSEYFFANFGTTTGMGTLRWKKYLIELLPIPEVDAETESQITSSLDALLASSYSDRLKLIQKIDQKVYNLFGFTSDEVSFIEKSVENGAH